MLSLHPPADLRWVIDRIGRGWAKRKAKPMKHRILTCKHHPNLRWSCKDIAWSGFYNGSRNIFFNGEPSGKGMFEDGSGLDCTLVPDDPNGSYERDGHKYRLVQECECSPDDLILAPEDSLVTT